MGDDVPHRRHARLNHGDVRRASHSSDGISATDWSSEFGVDLVEIVVEDGHVGAKLRTQMSTACR